MADPIYTSASPIAVNPANGELIGGATFTVHAPDDTSFSTPLAVTDPNTGVAINPLRSNSNGTLPTFKVAGDLPRVKLKSGAFVTELVSLDGLVATQITNAGLGPETVSAAIAAAATATTKAGEAAGSAGAAAETLGEVTLKASAVAEVVATNDGIMATVMRQPGSAFAAEVDAAIAAGVPAEVAVALGEQPEVLAAAVALAQSDAGLVLKSDPGVPTTRPDTDPDMIRWRSKIGRRFLAAVSKSGVFRASGVQLSGGGVTADLTRSDFLRGTRIRVPGRAHPVLAQDALMIDGRVPTSTLTEWATRMPSPRSGKGRGTVSRGDSLTAGAFGDGVSYPQHLSTLAGVPVAKRGNPGERAKEISLRQGSTPLTVNADLSVPASGATAAFAMNTSLIFTNPNGVNGTPDGLAMIGTLGGIRGTLTATGGMFTFTRATAGDAATVPAGTPWLDEWESTHRDWNQIIWVGRNNVTASPSDVAPYVAKMVAYQTGGDFLVLSVTNATSEPSGSANYATILGINAALQAAYPNNYLDIRSWLIANGLAAVSITPTSDDTAAIAQDRIPPSLLSSDGLHLNANGYRAVAIAVYTWITAKGWL